MPEIPTEQFHFVVSISFLEEGEKVLPVAICSFQFHPTGRCLWKLADVSSPSAWFPSLPDLRIIVSLDGYQLGQRKLDRIIIHQDFDPANRNNDIALILLDSPIAFDAQMMPICLPLMHDLRMWQDCWVTSWSATVAGTALVANLLRLPFGIMARHRRHCSVTGSGPQLRPYTGDERLNSTRLPFQFSQAQLPSAQLGSNGISPDFTTTPGLKCCFPTASRFQFLLLLPPTSCFLPGPPTHFLLPSLLASTSCCGMLGGLAMGRPGFKSATQP